MLTTLKPAYDQHRPLSKEKADNLKKLLKYVSPIYHPFYTTKTSQGVLPSFKDDMQRFFTNLIKSSF